MGNPLQRDSLTLLYVGGIFVNIENAKSGYPLPCDQNVTDDRADSRQISDHPLPSGRIARSS